jgi:parallel beta-helix repeat protein
MRQSLFCPIVLAFVMQPSASLLSQGSLTPPGAPTPTFKTLQQVEPRTDLLATPAPPGVDTSNASYHYIINQPGSYYLSANVNVTKPNGIQITAAGVTLDLGGFTVARSSGTGGFGVDVTANGNGESVRNGTIKGFAIGLRGVARAISARDLTATGRTSIGLQVGTSGFVESCRAYDNTGSYGITADFGSIISHCTVDGNTISDGINLANGGIISHCTAYNNTVNYAMIAGTDSTVEYCTAYSNDSAAPSSGGISISNGSIVSHCTVRLTSSSAALTATTGVGIAVGSTATVEYCTVSNNAGSGIMVTGDGNQVFQNTAASNAVSVTGGNIHLTAGANGNRIDSNHCTTSSHGIFVEGNDNLVVRNSAQNSSVANYDIAAGNHDAARVASPGTSFASTSPWVNFSY